MRPCVRGCGFTVRTHLKQNSLVHLNSQGNCVPTTNKENRLNGMQHTSHTMYKINSKWITDRNIKPKTLLKQKFFFG